MKRNATVASQSAANTMEKQRVSLKAIDLLPSDAEIGRYTDAV